MTQQELYTIYVNLASMYLKANSFYLKNWNVYDEKSLIRQKEILLVVNIYLKAIKFYTESFYLIENIIDINLINKVVNETVKLLTLFKSFYNET